MCVSVSGNQMRKHFIKMADVLYVCVCLCVCEFLASKFGQPSYVIYNQLTENMEKWKWKESQKNALEKRV